MLVSPESAKLLALKHDIEREDPRAKIVVAAKPDDYLPEMDVIVTATSAPPFATASQPRVPRAR